MTCIAGSGCRVQTYFNDNALTLIRTLITGGATPELEQILAEGVGMRGGYSTSEMLAHRNRCRVAHITFDDASLVQYTVRACRGIAVLHTLCWGLLAGKLQQPKRTNWATGVPLPVSTGSVPLLLIFKKKSLNWCVLMQFLADYRFHSLLAHNWPGRHLSRIVCVMQDTLYGKWMLLYKVKISLIIFIYHNNLPRYFTFFVESSNGHKWVRNLL